jgi:hypothetical protein
MKYSFVKIKNKESKSVDAIFSTPSWPLLFYPFA